MKRSVYEMTAERESRKYLKKKYKEGKVVNAKLIRKKMKDLNLTGAELGEKIGAKRATVSLWKQGKTRSISEKFREKLCYALGIKDEELEIILN